DEAFVRVRGGHPDVDNGHLRRPSLDEPHQLLRVASLAHDLEVGLGEKPRKAFTHQRRVVGDHDPHGISARISAPFAVSRPWRGPTRSLMSTRRARQARSSPLGSLWMCTESPPSADAIRMLALAASVTDSATAKYAAFSTAAAKRPSVSPIRRIGMSA